jgi:hypothetical protein
VSIQNFDYIDRIKVKKKFINFENQISYSKMFNIRRPIKIPTPKNALPGEFQLSVRSFRMRDQVMRGKSQASNETLNLKNPSLSPVLCYW